MNARISLTLLLAPVGLLGVCAPAVLAQEEKVSAAPGEVATETPAAPLPFSPQPGEILLRGWVKEADATTRSFAATTAFFTLQNGRSAETDKKLKQVLLNEQTGLRSVAGEPREFASLAPHTAITVIGADDGSGAPLLARTVIVGEWKRPEIIANSGTVPLAPASPLAPAIPFPPGGKSRLALLPPAPKPTLPRTIEDRGRAATYVVRRFPLAQYGLQLSYVRCGHTAAQAVQRSAQTAVYAFGGGYFEPSTKRTIDLVVVDGKEIDDYRFDWRRPIIAVSNGEIKILRPNKRQPVEGAFDFAVATDYKATHRAAGAGRQIFGLKDGEMIFVRCYSTESSARHLMASMGVTDYVFLDGGSSTPPSSRIPTRLVVVRRPVPTGNLAASRGQLISQRGAPK